MQSELTVVSKVRPSRLLPVLAVIFFALTLSLLLFAFRDFFLWLGRWGYLGALIVMALNNATVIFPAAGHAFLIASAQVLNPWLLGIAGGVGATIGELTAYLLGMSGHAVIADTALYRRMRRLMRWTGPTLFVFAATPLPFDIAGIWAGSVRYSLWRFLLWSGAGKIVQTTTITVASYYAIGWLYRVFGLGITD